MGASLAWRPPWLWAWRPVRLLLAVRPCRSPWRVSLRSPRWRRTGPASSGPHSIPGSPSPYPRREQGPPRHSPWAARRAEGAVCDQGDAVEVTTSSPETPGVKRASSGGGWGASCRVIQARFRLPRAFHGPLLGSRRQVTGEKLDWAVPCAHRLSTLAGSRPRESPLPAWLQSYCSGSFLGGRPHSAQPRPGPGVAASGQGHRAGRKRKPAPRGELGSASTLLTFLWLVAVPY